MVLSSKDLSSTFRSAAALLKTFCSSFRGGSGGRFGGPAPGRIGRREALKTRPATRSRVTRRRATTKTTVTRTIRWNEAGGGGIVTASDGARTPPPPQMTTYLPTMTPASTVVFLTTLSWWVVLRVEAGGCGQLLWGLTSFWPLSRSCCVTGVTAATTRPA